MGKDESHPTEPAREDFPTLSRSGGASGSREQGRNETTGKGYRIIEKIGEGGMGTVWQAEQRSTNRMVAVKMMSQGVLGSQVAKSRFKREIQLAARLDHPNIAQVYSAGTTKTGQPYFIMEYVAGPTLTQYCDENKLSVKERLRLFLLVCDAIQYAHQKGIIHRDIKPSNIIVWCEEQDPIPKIIDFGLAKALDYPIARQPKITEQRQLLGTPEYMSPEQASMATEDIDTRSDIYSLGVVLYELLLGVLPFDSDAFRSGGMDRVRHIICDEEPKTPSARLNSLSQDTSMVLAQQRRSDVRSLLRVLHGDLDCITIKAMEKEQNHRYQTVQALADDIRRHLADEPIDAAPPTVLYRLRKFSRRRRATLMSVAAILITVVTSGAIGLYMYMGKAHAEADLIVKMEEADASARTAEGAMQVAEEQEHRRKYDNARALYDLGRSGEALRAVELLTTSPYVGRQACLLKAQLSDPNVAAELLQSLTEAEDAIAGLAHLLLAQICLDSRSGNDQADQELELKAQKHLEVGETLLPRSAHAFLSRAMVASTIRERLEWLDKAVELDHRHYESYRARAVTYRLLRDYRSMDIDAVKMTSLRPQEPLGYQLAAMAFLESSALDHAIGYCTDAIRLDPDNPDLYNLRYQIHMRVRNYRKALADARRSASLLHNYPNYFSIFSAHVALEEFEQAKDLYNKVFARNQSAKTFFNYWATKYVFEVLSRSDSLGLPKGDANEPAFWIMHRAAEYFHNLSTKAKPIGVIGFKAVWAPDGTRLAYSRGVSGCNALEVYHLLSGKTQVLTVPGKDPAWSPDGRYIAFVRERMFQSLSSVADADVVRSMDADRETVWIIKADGTGQSRYIARGGMPSWSQDSKRLYFESRPPKNLCSIAIEPEGAHVRLVAPCASYYPVVSPDEKYVAYSEHFRDGRCELVVRDLHDPKVEVARWRAPYRERGLIIQWGPTSQEVSVGGFDGSDLGLWVYHLDTQAAFQVLDGPATSGAWFSDGSKLAFDLRLDGVFLGIWVAELKSGLSTCEALKPVRTMEEHYASLFHQYRAAMLAGAVDRSLTNQSIKLYTNFWLAALARYREGAYKDAYDAVTKADILHRGLYQESHAAFVAYQAMTLHLLGRLPEAKTTRDQLHGLLRTGKYWESWTTEFATETLLMAEHLLAEPDRRLSLLWKHAGAGKLSEACKVLEQIRSDLSDQRRDDAQAAAEVLTILWRKQALEHRRESRHAEVIRYYQGILRIDPNDIQTRKSLAWLLATCLESQFRDALDAVTHASRACELVDWKDPDCVDTLAAAYAATGDFESAIKWQQQAIDLLPPSKDPELLAGFQERLQLYRNGEMYRGPSLSPRQLVACWTFDTIEGEQVLDSSGNELHGRLHGDAHIERDSIRESVLSLDGDDDWIDCGDDARFSITIAITLVAWIKTDGLCESHQAIITKGDTAWRLQGTGEMDGLAFTCTGLRVEGDQYGGIGVRVDIEDGKWHHIAGVYDGQSVRLFVDGEKMGSAQASGRIRTNHHRVLIGGNSEYPGREWKGLIDDVRIYNYALSEDDIKTLYLETRRPVASE